MIDYDAIRCLKTVIELQGFERAGQFLGLTQSAVSQKIKRLEQQLGGPLVIRSKIVKATDLGIQVLQHYSKVSLLEHDFVHEILDSPQMSQLTIGVNNDGLATWFSEVMTSLPNNYQTQIHIKAADQRMTREKLQQGEVLACVSEQGAPVAGCDVTLLGYMEYELVATPRYVDHYFKEGLDPALVLTSPSLIYDVFDELWYRYLTEKLQLPHVLSNSHWYPSSSGFVSLVLGGTVCALVPSMQIQPYLFDRRLVSLFPDRKLSIPMYWHSYRLDSTALNTLSKIVIRVGEKNLVKY